MFLLSRLVSWLLCWAHGAGLWPQWMAWDLASSDSFLKHPDSVTFMSTYYVPENVPGCSSSLLLLLTNYHKLSGSEQHIFVVLWFCRSEVWPRSHMGLILESRIPFWRLSGPAFLLATVPSSGCPYSLAHGAFRLQSLQWLAEYHVCFHCHLSSSDSSAFQYPCVMM